MCIIREVFTYFTDLYTEIYILYVPFPVICIVYEPGRFGLFAINTNICGPRVTLFDRRSFIVEYYGVRFRCFPQQWPRHPDKRISRGTWSGEGAANYYVVLVNGIVFARSLRTNHATSAVAAHTTIAV